MAMAIVIPADTDVVPYLHSFYSFAERPGEERHDLPQLKSNLRVTSVSTVAPFNFRATLLLAFFCPGSSRQIDVFGDALLYQHGFEDPSSAAEATTLMTMNTQFVVEVLPRPPFEEKIYSVLLDNFFDALLWATVLPTHAGVPCNVSIENLDHARLIRIVSWWGRPGGLGTPSVVCVT